MARRLAPARTAPEQGWTSTFEHVARRRSYSSDDLAWKQQSFDMTVGNVQTSRDAKYHGRL